MPSIIESGTESFGYSAGNRRRLLESYTGTAKQNDYQYSYEGELLKRTHSTPENYAYDDENRLIKAGSTSFQYDASGNRLSSIRGGIKTYYVYDEAGSLLAEFDQNKKLIANYYYGLGLISTSRGNTKYSYHFDGTGHVMAMTDASQKVVNQYAYSPFGLITKSEQFQQPFTYAGKHGVQLERGVKASGSSKDPSKVVYYMRRSTLGTLL